MKKIFFAVLALSAAAVSTNAVAESGEYYERPSLALRAAIGAGGPVIETPSFLRGDVADHRHAPAFEPTRERARY